MWFNLVVALAAVTIQAAKLDSDLIARYLCNQKANDFRASVPGSCSKYYECHNNAPLLRTCPRFFDASSQKCVATDTGCMTQLANEISVPAGCSGACCGISNGFALDPINNRVYYECKDNCIVSKHACAENAMFNLGILKCSEPKVCGGVEKSIEISTTDTTTKPTQTITISFTTTSACLTTIATTKPTTTITTCSTATMETRHFTKTPAGQTTNPTTTSFSKTAARTATSTVTCTATTPKISKPTTMPTTTFKRKTTKATNTITTKTTPAVTTTPCVTTTIIEDTPISSIKSTTCTTSPTTTKSTNTPRSTTTSASTETPTTTITTIKTGNRSTTPATTKTDTPTSSACSSKQTSKIMVPTTTCTMTISTTTKTTKPTRTICTPAATTPTTSTCKTTPITTTSTEASYAAFLNGDQLSQKLSNLALYLRFVCRDKPDGSKLISPRKCSEFYVCIRGFAMPLSCGDKYFNPEKGICDITENTRCYLH